MFFIPAGCCVGNGLPMVVEQPHAGPPHARRSERRGKGFAPNTEADAVEELEECSPPVRAEGRRRVGGETGQDRLYVVVVVVCVGGGAG